MSLVDGVAVFAFFDDIAECIISIPDFNQGLI